MLAAASLTPRTPVATAARWAGRDGAAWWLAFAITLASPVFLLHVRVAAEGAIDAVAVLFVARSVWRQDWRWARRAWVAAATAWWAWTLLCTVLAWFAAPQDGPAHVTQAALVLRFLLFAAALEHWVLRHAAPRRALLAVLSAAVLYVAGQVLLQFFTGRNLAGDPRWGDGELTGPFRGPRAAPTLVRMLFPALLPAMAALQRRPLPWGRIAAAALAVVAIGVLVLIGQRMPVLLAAIGLLATALMLPRFRSPALLAALAAAALIAASAVVAPPTFYRLVTKFSHQVETLPESPYGQIAGRAAAMAQAEPWTGLGFNGFQAHCADPRFQHGWRWPADPADDGGGAEMCTTHPHNFYLQALTDSGYPGLLAFTVLVLCWLAQLGRGLWRTPDPLRAGLFVALLIQVWPIASTSPLVSLPIGGWFFLLLGFGLACANPPATPDAAVNDPAA